MSEGLSRKVGRRSFLARGVGMGAAAGAVGAAGALGLSACSSGSSTSSAGTTGAPSTSAPTTTTTVIRRTGQRPDPTKPEGTDLLPQIEHILVVMMENHSYDNYFGVLDKGDGLTLDSQGKPTETNPGKDGKPVPMFHMANTCQPHGLPSQQWNDMITQWNRGKMDGFVRSLSGVTGMGYWTGKDLPFYEGLAKTFPLCDRWFASCFGQTYPNRRYLLAGTSMGTIHTISEPDPTTLEPPNGTVFDALVKHGITCTDYYTNAPSLGLYLPSLARNIKHIKKMDTFFTDAAAGKLPSFALLEPDFDRQSEEDPQDISVGESYAAKVVNAVMQSPAWPKTLLIWTYDEHGGYYDHVPPPAAVAPDGVPPRLLPGDKPFTFARYGFRVPTAIISPYAKKDYVSHVVHDHTSVLSLVEHKWNLPAFTNRDGAADNLLDSLDLEGAPAFLTPPTLPAPRNPHPSNPIAAPICTAPGPIPNPAG
jgi:phospholipase C